MTKLIGIHGAARSGKDTLARMLIEEARFVRMAFADPLKSAVAIAFNIPSEVVFSDDKHQLIPTWGLTLREILQKFGTESMRNVFGRDFWIKRWLLEFEQTVAEGVVLADVRFDNEAEIVRELGGMIVHLERRGSGLKGKESQHSSEGGIRWRPGDATVRNDGTLNDLRKQARIIVDLLP